MGIKNLKDIKKAVTCIKNKAVFLFFVNERRRNKFRMVSLKNYQI